MRCCPMSLATHNAAEALLRGRGSSRTLPVLPDAVEKSSRLKPLPQDPGPAVAVDLDLDLDLRGPSVAAEPADKTRRALHMDVQRFPQGGMPFGKSRRLRGPGAQHRARRRGVLSLRQVSLHKQRKVARAVTARKPLILSATAPKHADPTNA